MDFSVITVGHVQNVLSAMQKNLECPICLDVVQEPVSTKCDHIFCRFCMFKLISKKKKGVAECPLCKTEVTKRSLKENSRFKQLIEGLLETIRAFELDTGVKFLKSHRFPKTSTEATAPESLCKESSVIQSKGFRNRRKSAKGNGQENCTLQEANVDIQLTETKTCRPRDKPQKCDSSKGIYMEFGSESSEEFFKQASKTGFEDKAADQISSQERLEELESAEKGSENSCNVQPDKLCAKEITLPNIIGKRDFSKEGLSEKSTQSITECAKPDQVNVTECQSSALNVLAVDLLPEQRDRIGAASPTVNGDTSFFKNSEEMGGKQTQCNSKNQEFDSEDSSEGRLDKNKEMDADVQNVEAVEAYEPENDSSHDKELPLEKLHQPETLHSATLNKVSKKRLKRSIQKVNEWFSKSNEILSSSSSLDESAVSADVSGEGDLCLSDKESCISEKTDPMVDSMEIAAVEGNKRWSKKQTADDIKDKIFGKTYKRERKSNPPSALKDILPTTRKEDVAADKCLNNFSKDRLKRKRKTACVLQPEDFIKKKDTEEADGGPQSVNCCLGDAEKKRCDGSVAVNESHLSQNRANNTLTELEEAGGSTWKKATEEVTGKHCDGELEMCNCDQKSTKKRSSAAKRCRHSSRTMCALQLVVDRSSVFPDPAEPQIDSYPSSGEPRKVDSEQKQVRRSRRLQLLTEEMTKETRKGLMGARKSNSDHGRCASGGQRNVVTDSAECKDLCEPRDTLSYKPATNLKGGDLEANEMQVSLKNLSDTAETGKSLFSPSRQPSNCGPTAPHTSSQDREIQGSPLLLQPPSVTAVQTASHQTEETTESHTAFPQECGHDSQSVPGDFKTDKLPMAKNVLELTKEAEDSELDTQYLRNIFRHSKRSSFSLFQTPRQTHAVEGPASETLSCAAQGENKHSKQLQPESLQEEKTAAQSLSRVSEQEKLKTCESAHVDRVSFFVVSTGEHRNYISQAAGEGTLAAVTRTGTAQTEDKTRLLQEEQGHEKPVSTEIGIESELRQNAMKNRSQSDQSNTEKHDSKEMDLNTGQETGFSSESNQAGETEVVDCKGPTLHFQSKSVICPATCQQSPAEFSCVVTRTKSSKRERKCVKGNEEQAAQTVSTAMPECLAAEALEEPLRGNSDLTGLSETPDGLLCSDVEENTSLCEADRKEQSAVFVKSDNALGKELHNRNASSKPRSRGIHKSRRRVQKLPSSDEESCEDEDLPCFQTLIFSKSASTPLQSDKQMTSVVESPVSPNTFPHGMSNDDNVVQKVPEAAQSNVCVSPSQESECSVNLFSSQSNMSEESVNGAQELKKHLPEAHVSKQMSSVNDSEETFQNCDGGLKRTEDECQEDPDMGANLGEASGYDSEISIVEDSCGPLSQGEILTTQQKNAMQNSLKKLQQEMAVLEAVLKQHGSQNCEALPVHREPPHAGTEGTFEMDQMREGKRSPELLLPSSKSSSTQRSDLEKGLECDSVLKNESPSEKTKPVQEAVQEYRQCQLEAENAEEQKSGTRQNSASVSSDLFGNVTQSPNNSSSSVGLFTPQTAEATDEPVIPQNTDKSCGPGHKLKKSVCFPAPVLDNATGKENATSPVVTKRKEMSIVASGLNHSELLVVQKFVKKTQSTLSNHITEGTTHVIMKTDEELVCERTLKYFLGIAGGKWVVSYQWIIQSFKERRILDEENFEVRGDVINGRNHQGPKRARQALTEKIFKDFEICCYGPFTDMTTEHLEWMVELCGASVVKQPDLFTHTGNSTAVVVVQPDAWKENTDYRAIHQQNNVAVVTREWVLDSVACYECQEFGAYLMS
ncbi:breast cancer type 1 susceptibility protein isoform X1 [Corvus moneduloides]|uniref:breast cancer type 1 susceptibility protein isoform X1 n=1 Tax=Corvus moneduloides TaxID=1196302 RepID=UPI0013633E2B|nr:breast cancer type 1 susceptibility protein isoform X1 [Corvus moneduloides]XP_031990365.1 breast cancer type 1 susceptibility protein isoform X1 [Corvus moneduloides]XP_031990366.1 breast cancer type 1 susceptibility protein isoform X1 [Corvus moneduloides]XP_031990368.1 breast cancer type 1 susceptibility protein isoform X1 [Corvus moneduloides]